MNRLPIDIKETFLYRLDRDLLATLLKDRSSGKNIIWATDNYAHKGDGFQWHDHIEVSSIIGYNSSTVKPRVEKSKKEQIDRIKQKAEVFTPSWVCNKQNNLVDNAWFGSEDVFNVEHGKSWDAKEGRIGFPSPSGKSWKEYVQDVRLEITCGEAPYLVSRYDTVTGEHIDLPQRIGLLDRKMRVVMENAENDEDWNKWAIIAFQSIYGFDWQGDNVLLARENMLLSFIDYYEERFEEAPKIETLRVIADILSWNIWQMDGLKFVIPDSCVEVADSQIGLFDENPIMHLCEGCEKNDPLLHTGIYCQIMDWEENKPVKFVSLLNKRG